MKARELKTAIIQNIGAYSGYSFEALDTRTIELLGWGRDHIYTKKTETTIPALIRQWECFLQISNQKVTFLDFSRKSFQITCEQFIGAINSDHFICLSHTQRWLYSHALVTLLVALKPRIPELFKPDFDISSRRKTEYVMGCVKQFEALNLDEEKIWLWRGWPVKNRDGIVTWLQFYPLYQRLGRDFTTALHQVCADYYGSRKAQRIVAMPELASFIAKYPHKLEQKDFQSPRFLTKFWRKFIDYYMTTGVNIKTDKDALDRSITTLTINWRTAFVPFVREYLIPSGLIAEQYGELPSPNPRKRYGSKTHIRKTDTGDEIKVKLLTHIPLHVTDQEAMEILFREIQKDFDIIVNWAKWAAEDIWLRYQRRIKLAPLGKIHPFFGAGVGFKEARWLTNRENPDHLRNAAATFQHYGYLKGHDINVSVLYPLPLSQTAHELALPVTGALLPHLVLLVANHPMITPSFLEKLELWDINGKLVGFVKIDKVYVLDGNKCRRGPSEAQQVVHLNEQTTKVVQQMIELTEPLRKYLKEKGDDNWRYLLLTCRQGFGYPNRIRRIATDTSFPPRLEALAESLANTTNLSLENRMEYVQRFSLPALRASAGVLIYLREKSVKKMAEALGHAEYDAGLLSCYLPEPILSFFQERWIRISQTGIIVESLKDSKYLLEASGFSSMPELDEFLSLHALKKIPKNLEDPAILDNQTKTTLQSSGSEVVFGVNVGILTVMLSLQQAVAKADVPVNGMAKYWSGITACLVNYIESKECRREDLKGYLLSAKHMADPSKMEAIIID